MTVTNEIGSCEVCGSQNLESALDLGQHPMCDDLVAVGDSRVCREFPIEILYCTRCATAHQRFQVPKQELFPRSYHYRSRFTADVLDGMAELAAACETRLGSIEGKVVVDIGCNDGSLLDAFRARGARTVGVEPTDAYRDGLSKGHDLVNAFFTLATAEAIVAEHGHPDVVTFTNVFAHIEDLPSVISALKILMGPTSMLVIENHYLGAVLDRCQFDTFYHEHPRTYSLTSFLYIAKSLGVALTAVEFPSRYGGNIRVFFGGPASADRSDEDAMTDVRQREGHFGERLKEMQVQVQRWRETMGARLRGLAAMHGPLTGKAFPGRAAILVKLLGVDCDIIGAVHEKPGSMKVGHYLPGTRIPIRSDDDLPRMASFPGPVVNLAWHIPAEIRRYLTHLGYTGEVVDILDADAAGQQHNQSAQALGE